MPFLSKAAASRTRMTAPTVRTCRSSHPRAWPAACGAEAAALQGRFWEMHDSMFADQGRLEDPHLWDRARALGLDLHRFEADRRGEAVVARVRRDFESGVRAGVVTTPTVFAGGRAATHYEPLDSSDNCNSIAENLRLLPILIHVPTRLCSDHSIRSVTLTQRATPALSLFPTIYQ